MVRVYRLHVTYPEGAFEPGWEPPGWKPGHYIDPDTGALEPMEFRWPTQRLFLSRSAAQRRAVQLRSYGAKVEVEESEPVVWGRILPHPAPGTYGQPKPADTPLRRAGPAAPPVRDPANPTPPRMSDPGTPNTEPPMNLRSSDKRRTPAAIIAYIKIEDLTGQPEIVQTYTPGEGWREASGRCTLGHIRDLRDAGVTAVSVRIGNHVCDFRIGNLLY